MVKALMLFAKWFAIVTAFPVLYILSCPKKTFEDKDDFDAAVKGGAVIVCNHTQWMDGPVLTLSFLGKKFYYLIAKDVLKSPVFKLMALSVNCVPFDRHSTDFTGFADIVGRIRKGDTFVIFPEGKIEEGEGISAFMEGAAMLAAMSGRPVIPICKTKSRLFKRTRLAVGKSRYVSAGTKGLASAVSAFNSELELEMIKLKRKL